MRGASLAILMALAIGVQANPLRSFVQANRITTINRPGPLAFGDFDEDGRMDFAVSNALGTAVMLNRGATVFERSEIPNSDGTFPALAQDVDRDGHLDLIYHPTDAFWVAYGNGAGAFRRPIKEFVPVTGAGPAYAYQVMDVDGDGVTDFVEREGADIVIRTIVPPATAREIARIQGVGSDFATIRFALGDFDGDHKIDVMVTTLIWTPVKMTIDVRVAWQNPGPQFVMQKYGTFDFERLDVVDVDGDAVDELAAAEAPGSLTLLRFPGRSKEQSRIIVPSLPAGVAVATSDVDRDGNPDLLLTGAVAWATARGQWEPPAFFEGVGSAATLIDLDGDGMSDFVSTNSDGVTFVHVERGIRDFDAPLVSRGTELAAAGVTADLDGDGNPDIVSYSYDAMLSLMFGDGHGRFTAGPSRRLTRPVNVAASDFDGDGKVDLAISSAGVAQILFGDGTRDFGKSSLSIGKVTVVGGVHIGDRSSPAHLIVLDGSDVRSMTISSGRSTSTEKVVTIGTNDSVGITPWDDLRVRIGASYTVYTFDSGVWTAIPLPDEFYIYADFDHHGKKVMRGNAAGVPADMDQDGVDDVVSLQFRNAGESATVIVTRNSEAGSKPLTSALASQTPAKIFVFDADHDGWLDVVLLNQWITVLRNVAATPRVRVTMTPEHPVDGQRVTFTAYAVSTNSDYIGAIYVSEAGKTMAWYQPNLATDHGTWQWTSPPLTSGRHVYAFEYVEQYLPATQSMVTFDVVLPGPRRRASH